jgi:arylsulfatase A-like enzyme
VWAPTCIPLITGSYPVRPIGLEQPVASTSRKVELPPQHPMLPSLLQKGGYATAPVGIFHAGQEPLRSEYDQL